MLQLGREILPNSNDVAERKTSRSQGAGTAVLAKLTPPTLSAVYPRTRVFRTLDRAFKRPIVWISAPGGTGKTTLLASYARARKLPTLWYQLDEGDRDIASFFYYMGLAAKVAAPRYQKPLPLLTPAYQAGMFTFTANYFRDLFARIKRPSLVVFDNYQEAAGYGMLHEILRKGFDQIPTDVSVAVLSREPPPDVYTPLRVNGRMTIIGWEELKLTEQESAGIAKLRRKRAPLSRALLKTLHQETEGWVAGVVLLTEQVAEGVVDRAPRAGFATQSIFDYFANEIFLHSGKSTQTLLLKTAFLPKISPSIAAQLTQDSNAGALLRDLTLRNYFTVRHGEESYEYHPLFRAFLVNRANALYSPQELKALKSYSATLLAESGDVETAIALLLQAEEWAASLRLILRHAPALNKQGRTGTLEGWLRKLPDGVLTQTPWALYWLGVCRLAHAPAEARGYFERAFAEFEKQDDSSPLYLSWLRIIESFLFELQDYTPMSLWLDRYATLKEGRKPPNPSIENATTFTYVAALTHAHGEHPDLPIYAERARRLLLEAGEERQLDLAAALIPYYIWRGDVAAATSIVERLQFPARSESSGSLAQFNWYIWKSMHAADTGAAMESLRAVNDGLALAEATGIHLVDFQLLVNGIYGQLVSGDVLKARELLRRLSALPHRGPIKGALYSHHVSMVALLEGDSTRAVEEGRRALDFAKASGLSLGVAAYSMSLAYAYTQQGQFEVALETLKEARERSRAIRSKRFTSYCALCEADIYYRRGERELAVRALNEALSLAREGGFLTPACYSRDAAAALFGFALEAGVYPDYVRTLIAKTRLPPPRDVLPENWPWPIRIYTFGRFAIMKGDAPLVFSGRTQKKPLELLRAMSAFGGRKVSIQKLAQTLWPETDGDMGKRAVETTVHRLRRLLGEDCIVRQESQLTLNTDYCWVDIAAFDRLVASNAPIQQADDRLQQLLTLYRGEFLDDDDAPWIALQREKLRSKFLRAVTQLGEILETQGKWARAIDGYRRGIEIDPLAEDLYRRLMRCYQQLNQTGDALATYERCRNAVQSALKIEPSANTVALYEQIRSATR